METVENKYITVAYKLYTMEDGEKELFEEAKAITAEVKSGRRYVTCP